MFKYAGNEKAMDELMKRNSEVYASISDKDIAMIETFLNMDLRREKKEQGVVSVCKAWDDHYESGRRKGREEGRNILYRLVSKGYISKETAASTWQEWQGKDMQ